MRVLIADNLAGSAVARLEAAGCAVVCERGLSGEGLREALGRLDPEVLVVRSTRVNAAHLEAAPSLALVVRAGAGVNTIDVDAAARRAIAVANCPGRNAVAVAEMTIGHLINLDRRISDQVALLREGRWAKGEFGGRGLKGRTLAVLGLGEIGRAVASRAMALGMIVRAWSRSLTPEVARALGVERAATSLDACRGADALSIHVALAPETRGLVGRDHLDALRSGAYVVNTSRAEVIDAAALVEAIETRGLRVGLDVFAKEPTGSAGAFEDPIARRAEVYGTHHTAASTEQAAEAVAEAVVEIVEAFHRTGEVSCALNIHDASDANHVLRVRHLDEVGVLARVLGLLSEAGINVQEMSNAIFSGGEAAVASIQVSSRPGAALLEAVSALESVYAVGLVERRG